MSTPIAPRAAGGRSLRGHRRALQLPRLPTRGGPRPRTELSAIPRASIARIFVIRDENTNRRCDDPPVRARTSRAGFAAVGVLIAATVFFAFTARARGEHTGWWFWTGYLPKADGTRTVLHGDNAPPTSIRVSWSPCYHRMRWIKIENSGSWLGGNFYAANGCDQDVLDQFPAAV